MSIFRICCGDGGGMAFRHAAQGGGGGDLLARLADPDAEVRRIAVMELPYCDEEEILPLLLAALADDDAQVQAEAARALEGFEEPEAVGALLARLSSPS